METRYYVLSEHDAHMMREQLIRAIHFCEKAEPYDMHDLDKEYTYPGATGYSQSAMEDCLARLDSLPKTVEFY